MIEIHVTVEIPGIPEALNRLADALSVTRQPTEQPTEQPEPVVAPVVEIPAPRKRRAAEDMAEDTKPVEAKPEELTPPTPKEQVQDLNVYAVHQAEPVAQQATVDTEATPKKEITLEQISKAGLALMDAGRLNDLMGLLAKYGLQSLTAADPKQYAAIADDLVAMGGTIPEVG